MANFKRDLYDAIRQRRFLTKQGRPTGKPTAMRINTVLRNPYLNDKIFDPIIKIINQNGLEVDLVAGLRSGGEIAVGVIADRLKKRTSHQNQPKGLVPPGRSFSRGRINQFPWPVPVRGKGKLGKRAITADYEFPDPANSRKNKKISICTLREVLGGVAASLDENREANVLIVTDTTTDDSIFELAAIHLLTRPETTEAALEEAERIRRREKARGKESKDTICAGFRIVGFISIVGRSLKSLQDIQDALPQDCPMETLIDVRGLPGKRLELVANKDAPDPDKPKKGRGSKQGKGKRNHHLPYTQAQDEVSGGIARGLPEEFLRPHTYRSQPSQMPGIAA